MMNRKDFLTNAWRKDIRPFLIMVALIVVAVAVLNISFDSFSLNWRAIGALFISGVKNNWQLILGVVVSSVLLVILRSRISPTHRKTLDKVVAIIGAGIVIDIVVLQLHWVYCMS